MMTMATALPFVRCAHRQLRQHQTIPVACLDDVRASLQRRDIAYGTNWKGAPSVQRKKKVAAVRSAPSKIRPAAGGPAAVPRQPSEQRATTERRNRRGSSAAVAPPALLVPTGSPHVFASKFAAEHRDDFDVRAMFRPHEGSGAAADEELARVRPRCSYHGTTAPPGGSATGQPLPEVAFLGRSNVGKSSLLNALTGHNFQRVSKQPGRTQHPHYLECRSSRGSNENILGYLMDLPGYGYAVGPEETVDAWQRRTQQVLLRRRDVGALRRIYLLVDARHGATALDLSVMSWLEEGEFPFTAVMTKGDATSPPFVVKHANQICMRYHHEASSSVRDVASVMISPFVHVTSAKNRVGLAEIWSSVLRDFRVDYT